MNKSTPIYVVSAPSGTGKTTLNRRLLKEHATVEMSVSYTARPQRPGEVAGVDYHYVTAEEFRAKITHGDMLEWAEVFGKLYGTARQEIDRIRAANKKVLLEIDVQGWRQAKTKLASAVSVFILPPSIEALWQRLEQRGTEALDVRWRRLLTAKSEIEAGSLYDYFIVNADLEQAYSQLQDIVINDKKGKITNAAGTRLCQDLLKEFDAAPWLTKLKRQFADSL
jgi:guanylate kinase